MVHCCCVYGCGEKFTKGGPFTFHCFPKNEARRKLWEEYVRPGGFTSTNFSRICSKHFTYDCFDKEKTGGSWLTKEAVPTIFHFDEVQKKQPKKKKGPKGKLGSRNSRNDLDANSSDTANKEDTVCSHSDDW
ncbi:hypothetical protein JTE90_017634 [Oedothorax gibbosus]|uniref:THAP-type domain-containing protein n=1 Tax=Oedothorax gibbosus TaxID=931172 RepID=A0AAV6U7C3_9ARAC|nr:hypothetical protein JTE90_017634 [Oedothorax gibbosus]